MINSKLNIKDKAERDPIRVAPFKKEVRTTKPHKHNNYLEIVYLSKGSGYHAIDADTLIDWKTTVILVLSLMVIFVFKKINSAFIVLGAAP